MVFREDWHSPKKKSFLARIQSPASRRVYLTHGTLRPFTAIKPSFHRHGIHTKEKKKRWDSKKGKNNQANLSDTGQGPEAWKEMLRTLSRYWATIPVLRLLLGQQAWKWECRTLGGGLSPTTFSSRAWVELRECCITVYFRGGYYFCVFWIVTRMWMDIELHIVSVL